MSVKNKTIVLAYSGGLDTSYCAVYLSKVMNYNVHAVLVNTGSLSSDEIVNVRERALSLGVHLFVCEEKKLDYYQKVIKFLVFGNVLKNNTYPLSVSAERFVQAKAVADYARRINADAVAHGSTGAGNDQVRFDAVFNVLIPEIPILTPIRDHSLSRLQSLKFLEQHGFYFPKEKAKYSINDGVWGTSVGGCETLTSDLPLPEEAFPNVVRVNHSAKLILSFDKGELNGVNDNFFDQPVEAIQFLSDLVKPYGLGRDIHVGDTIIGIKGRVGFEAGAALLILKAHHALEKHTLTKQQLNVKDQLALTYGNWLHEGYFLDPVMRNLEAFFESSQAMVSGLVYVTIKPYQFLIDGIKSNHDLMHSGFGSYGEQNKGWSANDVKGYTKIMSNQMSIFYQVNGYGEN